MQLDSSLVWFVGLARELNYAGHEKFFLMMPDALHGYMCNDKHPEAVDSASCKTAKVEIFLPSHKRRERI